MAKSKNENNERDRLITVLGNAVSYVTNEALVLAQYEAVQEDKFVRLWPEDDSGNFDKRISRVVEHLGGPPEFYLLRNDQEPPLVDNYPEATMREAFAMFSRTRKSILKRR